MEGVVIEAVRSTLTPLGGEIELLAFDFDGVVIDSLPGIAHCCSLVFEEHGFPVPDVTAIRSIIGPPLEIGMASLLEGVKPDAELIAALVVDFRRLYADMSADLTDVFPGVISTLERLQSTGFRLAIATSKPSSSTETLLSSLGLAGLFDHIECAASPSDTKSAVLTRVLSRDGADPHASVMVGDRHHDITAAMAVGSIPVGALWGYGSRDELVDAGAEHLIEEIGELHTLVGR